MIIQNQSCTRTQIIMKCTVIMCISLLFRHKYMTFSLANCNAFSHAAASPSWRFWCKDVCYNHHPVSDGWGDPPETGKWDCSTWQRAILTGENLNACYCNWLLPSVLANTFTAWCVYSLYVTLSLPQSGCCTGGNQLRGPPLPSHWNRSSWKYVCGVCAFSCYL